MLPGSGSPTTSWVSSLLAVVVCTDPGIDEAQLLEHCRAHLSHFKCPREIRFVETLPRTAMGKLDKRRLRADHSLLSRSAG